MKTKKEYDESHVLNYSTGSVLRVEWLDSAGGGGWKNAEGFSGGVAKVLSLGIFVHEDSDQITLCSSIANGPDGEHYMDPLSIPKCCISSEKVILQNTDTIMKKSKQQDADGSRIAALRDGLKKIVECEQGEISNGQAIILMREIALLTLKADTTLNHETKANNETERK
jgi:hypothetical protein